MIYISKASGSIAHECAACKERFPSSEVVRIGILGDIKGKAFNRTFLKLCGDDYAELRKAMVPFEFEAIR